MSNLSSTDRGVYIKTEHINNSELGQGLTVLDITTIPRIKYPDLLCEGVRFSSIIIVRIDERGISRFRHR